MESVEVQAKENLNFEELYLFTKHETLYEKFGWEFVSNIKTYKQNDSVQKLYKKKL